MHPPSLGHAARRFVRGIAVEHLGDRTQAGLGQVTVSGLVASGTV